jgi:hypothetical protein
MTTQATAPLLVAQVPIDQLRPDPGNPRRISEDELDALERSLRPHESSSPPIGTKQGALYFGWHRENVFRG